MLSVSSPEPQLRAYAYCAKDNSTGNHKGINPGGVVLTLINLDTSSGVSVDVEGVSRAVPREDYILTSPTLTSRSIALNGRTLQAYSDGW